MSYPVNDYDPMDEETPPVLTLAEPLNGAPPVNLTDPHTIVTLLLLGGSVIALVWGAVKHVKDGWQ